MAKRVFKINNKVGKFYSMMDVARELGIARIYPKDFDRFGVVEITGTPEADDNDPVLPLDLDTKKDSDIEVKKAEPKQDSSVYTMDDLVKLSLGDFSKLVKIIPTEDVVKFSEKSSLETFADATDERIRRMKLIMSIKKKFYPGQSLPPKKVSFKGASLDELVDFAKKVKVEYKESNEEKIQKMWVIYALNQSGFFDLPEKEKQTMKQDE